MSALDATVPGLAPYELQTVPGWDPADDDGWRTRWRAWRNDLYVLRADLAELCEHDPAARAAELAVCAADPAYWLAMYAWIEEPRPRPGEDAIKPFAPFAFQAELMQWFVRRTESSAPFDGFVSKARGLGASWIFAAAALWGFLFRDWRGKLVSRKEDLVDKPGDLDSLFGKIDFMFDHLPDWMLPAGWRRDEYRKKLLINHPNGYNQIVGESTSTKTGRGGRAAYVIVDEAAFVPDFVTMFGTLAATSDHRWCVSSESFEEGRGWRQTWEAAKQIEPDSVRELDYQANPYFDAAWREAEEKRWANNPEGFKVEYLRNPWAGEAGFVYPEIEQCPWVEEGFDPALPVVVAIDPGRADDTAVVVANLVDQPGHPALRVVATYERNLMPAEWYAHVLTGIEPEEGDLLFDEWTFSASDRDREALAFFGRLSWDRTRVRFFMDPAGAAKDMSGKSFHNRLVQHSLFLRKRHVERLRAAEERPALLPTPVPVFPIYKELFAVNRHDKRRAAAREWLRACSLSKEGMGVDRFFWAFREHRFNKRTDNSTSQPTPLHDETSHLVSAFEYMCLYLSMKLGPKPFDPDAPLDPGRKAKLPRLTLGRRRAA